MIRFLADENFDNDILRGIFRRNPSVDIVRVQDIGLLGANDELVLERAADENRVLLTHDVRTITKFAYERTKQGLLMPGVFEIAKNSSTGSVIEDILLLVDASLPGEWDGQIRYLPLK